MVNLSRESMAEVAGFLLIVGFTARLLCNLYGLCSSINFSLKFAKRWSFLNRDHEGHQDQASARSVFTFFSVCMAVLVAFLPRPTSGMFCELCVFSLKDQ